MSSALLTESWAAVQRLVEDLRPLTSRVTFGYINLVTRDSKRLETSYDVPVLRRFVVLLMLKLLSCVPS